MVKRIVFIICAALCALLIVFSADAQEAARDAFTLWQNALLPSLLPFFVCARLLLSCGAVDPSEPVALFALSFLSGAPSGARLCASLESDARCPYAPTLVAASLNTLSPAFVWGAFGASMLGDPVFALPVILGQFVSSLAFFILFYKTLPVRRVKETQERAPLYSLFVSSVTESVKALLGICGMVVVFSVFIRVLTLCGAMSVITWPLRMLLEAFGFDGEALYPFTSALLEAATGARLLADFAILLRAKLALAAFAFTFGGLCVAAQSMLFMRLDMGRYVLAKLAQGTLAAFVAWLLFPLFAPLCGAVSASFDQTLQNGISACLILTVSLFSMSTVMLLCAVMRRSGARRLAKAARDRP